MTHLLEWHTAARAYLTRVCKAEYDRDRAIHIKRHRSPKTFRYAPSDYVNTLIDCLNRDDEESFKAIKMLEGYASIVGV